MNQENLATKGKMAQIQQMMLERRLRKQARREARAAPYQQPTDWSPSKKQKTTSESSSSDSKTVPPVSGAGLTKSAATASTSVESSSDVTMTDSSAMYEDFKPGAMVA